MILAYQDMLDHILAYGGDDATAAASTKHRRAVQDAYKAMATRHNWLYFVTLGRVTTNGSYSTGTVAYDHTGGAVERQLTLTSGTWPSWAADGYVVIDSIPYQVEARLSGTVLKLSAATNPGEDLAALTEYELLRDQFGLPADFVSIDETVVNEVGTVLEYVHPRNWSSQRRTNSGPGQPLTFSLVGNPAQPGTLKMTLFPAPDAAYAIDFLYRRRPRALVYEAVSDGLVSVSADSTTVTGIGTLFRSGMVGSVIRFAADNQVAPTGDGGGNPAVYERTITAYVSPTQVTVGEAIPEALDSVKYVVTDPCDVNPDGMAELLKREAEKMWRIINRSANPKVEEDMHCREALTRALEADNLYSGRQAAGRSQRRRSGFDHFPINLSG